MEFALNTSNYTRHSTKKRRSPLSLLQSSHLAKKQRCWQHWKRIPRMKEKNSNLNSQLIQQSKEVFKCTLKPNSWIWAYNQDSINLKVTLTNLLNETPFIYLPRDCISLEAGIYKHLLFKTFTSLIISFSFKAIFNFCTIFEIYLFMILERIYTFKFK